MQTSMFQRAVSFSPALARFLDSRRAAIFLAQAVFWVGKSTHHETAFYKSQAEWEDETTLTPHEQRKVRERLADYDWWHEERKGLPAKLWYDVDITLLRRDFLAWQESVQSGSDDDLTSSERRSQLDTNEFNNSRSTPLTSNTESTTENTNSTHRAGAHKAKDTSAPPSVTDEPDWADDVDLADLDPDDARLDPMQFAARYGERRDCRDIMQDPDKLGRVAWYCENLPAQVLAEAIDATVHVPRTKRLEHIDIHIEVCARDPGADLFMRPDRFRSDYREVTGRKLSLHKTDRIRWVVTGHPKTMIDKALGATHSADNPGWRYFSRALTGLRNDAE